MRHVVHHAAHGAVAVQAGGGTQCNLDTREIAAVDAGEVHPAGVAAIDGHAINHDQCAAGAGTVWHAAQGNGCAGVHHAFAAGTEHARYVVDGLIQGFEVA